MGKKGLRSSYINYLSKDKKGQITIFILIAIVIITAALLFFFVFPPTATPTEFNEQNPNAFIQTCIEDKIEETINLVSLQGGSVDPQHTILYQGNKVEYLCYTSEDYVLCTVQQPLLKQHVESEIEEEIRAEAANCFNALRDNYERRNYDVTLAPGGPSVELLPKRVITTFDYILTVSKGETRRYGTFSVVLNNNLYELTSIANSIIEWEATYGDAETTVYMTYYRDLKVEKKNQLDGSTIYILTDRNTGNKFQFASRSVAWPSGFGTVPVYGGEE